MKIFTDVKDSDIFYRCQNFKFYFSSEKRLLMFQKGFGSYSVNEASKFKYKYNLNIDRNSLELMFIFNYYIKCEKRGFKVEQLVNGDTVYRTLTESPLFYITGVDEVV